MYFVTSDIPYVIFNIISLPRKLPTFNKFNANHILLQKHFNLYFSY